MDNTRGGELGRCAELIAAWDKARAHGHTVNANTTHGEAAAACIAYVRAELSRAEGGFVVVPREPTPEMLSAMRTSDNWPSLLTEEAEAMYRALLAAAPPQAAPDGEPK